MDLETVQDDIEIYGVPGFTSFTQLSHCKRQWIERYCWRDE